MNDSDILEEAFDILEGRTMKPPMARHLRVMADEIERLRRPYTCECGHSRSDHREYGCDFESCSCEYSAGVLAAGFDDGGNLLPEHQEGHLKMPYDPKEGR